MGFDEFAAVDLIGGIPAMAHALNHCYDFFRKNALVRNGARNSRAGRC